MSLVAYDDSGESGIESEDEDLPSRPVTVKKEPATDNSSSSEDGSEKASVSKNIINDENQAAKPNAPRLIPIPSTHMTSINFDMKILDKNRSQPIRITIPSLKDFEEEEPKKPKLKPSTKGSSLFSMLPAPKNVTSSASSSLMPQSVAKTIKPKPKPVRRPTGRTPVPATVKTQQLVEEDESSEPVVSFFFSGAENEPLPPPIDFDLETSTVVGDSTPSASAAPMNHQTPVVSANSQILDSGQFASVGAHEDPPSESSFHSHPEEDTALLDTEALKKLCGSRDRKKGPDLSEIIEVSGSSLVGDASMILAKELSKEQPSHSFKRKSECSSVQRRKHQITYLAEQAKAQELELRNNWAQNRVTRKQTQAKYGF